MVVTLTQVGEEVVSAMIDSMRWRFIELCGLERLADSDFFSDQGQQVTYTNASLATYAGLNFDGCSCVDIVVRVKKDSGVPFELKLGKTRLTKARIDGEWLSGCERSHMGRRWKGNIMSVLERKFPEQTPACELETRLDGVPVLLTQEWFIMARSSVIAGWTGSAPPAFSKNAHQVAFEEVVKEFGGKQPFNEMASRLMNFDFYDGWVQDG